MNTKLLHGDRVYLVEGSAEADAPLMAQWSRDSEFNRLLDSAPAHPTVASQLQKELEQVLADEAHHFIFFIRSLADHRPIGFIGLDGVHWVRGDAFVGIGLGERESWGKGYGTDAMRVLLRYAFTELNLYRVSLDVFAYNLRALRSYEKAGFVVEGRVRQALHREGKRWDVIYMGILKEGWEKE